ncbi:MAG: Glycosyltransferase [uncultured Paraburkholderia sp.]|nr:MAG: Glycosyltransferase [uncultured Paraburkholderia sp.]CAH2935017.1 MAG: Glycosyltransferase [uncultured Paraburkholderia sp.]
MCVASLLPAHDDFVPLQQQLDAAGVQCWFPRRRHRALLKLWNLFAAVRRFRPDVIFAHVTIPSFYARSLPLRVPVVYVMHSATNDFERPLFRRIEHILSGRARMVIGVSQQGVTDYVQAIGPHPAMTVVPNGVDLARFAFTDDVDTSGAAPQVVQIGRYASAKNQLETVRPFSEVLKRIEGARLALYGVVEDPEYQQAVTELAKELGIADRVDVGGPRSDVATVLSEANVFVMPSRSEAHSVAFLEALASGVPIVASKIAAFSFANGFPNMQLVDTDDLDCYVEAIVSALGQKRAQRSLAGLMLRDTADRYRAAAGVSCGLGALVRALFSRGACLTFLCCASAGCASKITLRALLARGRAAGGKPRVTRETQVGPCLGLVWQTAQQIRWVIRDDDRHVFVLVDATAQRRNARVGFQ